MFSLLLFSAGRIDSIGVINRAKTAQLTFIAFIVAFSLTVLSGAPKHHFIPVSPILLISVFMLCLWFSFSRYGLVLGSNFSLPVLTGFQSFRIPLELILHRWAEIGTVPETMTWTGQNYDIVSGVLALIFAPLTTRRKFFAWIPSIVGLLLLINVLRVVLMSSPFPFSWPLERPLQLIIYMPYALIVPLCVAPALIGHLVVIRRLLREE